MNYSESTTFRASLALVSDEIRNVKALRQPARIKRIQFAIDLCLVAHGVRTGYLVDAICPPNPMHALTTLLKALREKSAAFDHVRLWHHTPTAQSFLVHTPLLQDRLAAVLRAGGGPESDCVFVTLDTHLSVSRVPPETLQQALRDVRSSMTESSSLSLALSDTLTEDILIPLAAVLIDYAVAYVPAFSAQTVFLQSEMLDVYTVSIKGMTPLDSESGPGNEHVLLKFSCPQVFASDHAELSPGTLVEKLQVKFSTRLGRIGMRAFVIHHTETQDRVAL
ncbi:hypothetical protein JVU11DRAFT_3357 [Chiua virens]|nr:hypothetical protein JVU11DRAFT_3357 [Chiua virens]